MEDSFTIYDIKTWKINVKILLDEKSEMVSDRMMSNVFVHEPKCKELKAVRYICLIYTDNIQITVDEFRSQMKDIKHVLPN